MRKISASLYGNWISFEELLTKLKGRRTGYEIRFGNICAY